MSRQQLVAAAILAMAACLSMSGPAHAVGTWPASVKLSTAAASPGDQVSFSGQGPDGVDSDSCIVAFDGVLLTGADCFWDTSGSIRGTFDVPTDAATGVSAAVSVCWPGCYDDPVDDVFPNYWQANTDLDIAVPFVEVPDVTCLPVKDAATRLERAGFKVSVTGEVGEVVTVQEPLPGAFIQQTVPVVLFLQAVLVPEVGGGRYDQARAALEETCLAISAVDGITEGTVTLQDPGARAQVAGGTSVSVTMSGPTTSSPSTTSPTTSPATPTNTSSPTTPPTTSPGTPPIAIGLDSDPVSFPVAWTPPALAVLVALLLAAGPLARAVRRHRKRVWVTEQVTVTARPGTGTTFETRPLDDNDSDHVLTVVPEEVRRSTTVEEDPS